MKIDRVRVEVDNSDIPAQGAIHRKAIVSVVDRGFSDPMGLKDKSIRIIVSEPDESEMKGVVLSAASAAKLRDFLNEHLVSEVVPVPAVQFETRHRVK